MSGTGDPDWALTDTALSGVPGFTLCSSESINYINYINYTIGAPVFSAPAPVYTRHGEYSFLMVYTILLIIILDFSKGLSNILFALFSPYQSALPLVGSTMFVGSKERTTNCPFPINNMDGSEVVKADPLLYTVIFYD